MTPDLPEMKGEDVPPQIVEAAQRGYSMHGAGLVANLIAAAWTEIERQVRGEVAEEIDTLREGVANKDKPYNEAFMHGCDCAARAARGEAP